MVTVVLMAGGGAHAAAPPAQKPTVAVLKLDAKGIDQNVVDLLVTSLVAALRKSDAFGRVVSTSELETLLGFERTKQLSDCSASSCMAEIAGALGVDRVVTGQVGNVGASYLFSISMLDTRSAVTLASVAERFKGSNAEPLLDAVEPMTRKLLMQAHMANSLAPPPVAAPPVSAPPPPAPAAKAAPVSEAVPPRTDAGPPPLVGWTLAGGGTAALVLSALVAIPVGILAYLGTGLVFRLWVVRQPFAGDVAGGVAAAPVLLVGAVLGTVSLAAMVAGFYLVLN